MERKLTSDRVYFEMYARLTLVKLFPEWAVNLKNMDKPDLQDEIDSIGIEVTSSTPAKTREIESYGLKRLGKEVTLVEVENFDGEMYMYPGTKNKLLSFSSTKGGLFTPNYSYEIEQILVQKMLKQETYKRYKNNDIYIFTGSSIVLESDINTEKIRSFLTYFNRIYINCLDHIFVLSSKGIDRYDFTNDDLKNFKQGVKIEVV